MQRPQSVLYLVLIGLTFILLTVPDAFGKGKDKDKGKGKDKSKDKGKDKSDSASVEERVAKILKEQPILDAHNDLPLNLRDHYYNQLEKFEMDSDLTANEEWMSVKPNETHTDIPRMKKGGIGIQFWAAYTKCASQYKDSVEQILEQIDVINRFIHKNRKNLQYAQSTAGIQSALKNGKIASLIGVEGGHAIQSSLGILRTLYDLGARYLTLTHSCNTPWADSSVVDNSTGDQEAINGGLSEFGLKIIDEMNRMGMMIDLSHTSVETQKEAIKRSKAPVIYSHSGAFAICEHHRNVKDEMLKMVKKNKGVVMINFYSTFVKCDGTRGTIDDVVAHIEHVRKVAGVDSLGFGSDFDGVEILPEGLEDVSKYPDLLKALIETGRWSDEDVKKIAGKNFLRVFAEVEAVRKSLKGSPIIDEMISRDELEKKKADMTAITAKFPGEEADPVVK